MLYLKLFSLNCPHCTKCLFLIHFFSPREKKKKQFGKHGKREYQDTQMFCFKWEEYDTFSQLHFIKYRNLQSVGTQQLIYLLPISICILPKTKTTLIMVLITNPKKTIMEMICNIIIYFTDCLRFFIPTTETETILCMLKCVIIVYPKGRV